MADIDLKTEAPDDSFNLDAVLIGADSQASSSPSIFSATTIWTYLKTLTNTWSGTNTFTGPVVVSGGITGGAGAFYEAGGNDVAIADGGTGSSTAAAARTALGLEIGADVQAYDANLDGDKLAAIEAGADVTDTANVTAAGALMDSEITSLSGIKTLTVPDTTTITAFGASLVDDVNAAAARATLGVDAAGTDNSTDVTLAGTRDYITLSGQVLTRNAIDLTTDVTGNLPVSRLNGGTSASASTFWRGDGAWVTPAGSGDMIAGTYDPATIAEQLVGLTATQTLTNKTLTSPIINTPALGANSVDAITEIAAAIKSGADGTLITGTPGSAGSYGMFNADGDLVDSGVRETALPKNYMRNPGARVSQQNGTSTGTVSGYRPADQISIVHSQDGVLTSAQVATATPGGSTHRVQTTVTTADATLAAGQYAAIRLPLEGTHIADWLFGTASAKDLVFEFLVNWPAGTYAAVLQNAAANRSFVREFTVTGGEDNTDTVKTVTFPGDTSGTWPTTAVLGATLYLTYATGSTYRTTADAWQAGNYLGTASTTNGIGTVSDVFQTGDLGLYADPDATGVAPPFVLADYEEDLRKCQRHFNILEDRLVSTSAHSGVGYVTWFFQVEMRVAPSMTPVGSTGVIFDDINRNHANWYGATTGYAIVGAGSTADATM